MQTVDRALRDMAEGPMHLVLGPKWSQKTMSQAELDLLGGTWALCAGSLMWGQVLEGCGSQRASSAAQPCSQPQRAPATRGLDYLPPDHSQH